MKNKRSLPGWKHCANMKLLATSIGKNACFYVQKANGNVEHLHVYEPRRQQRHLDLQKYTWNTPASTDLEPQERLAKSPPSLSLSLPCASFTHTTPGVSRRLNHSVRMDHWRAAAESQGATLGASLLRGNYPEDCFLFFLGSVSSAPRNPTTSP